MPFGFASRQSPASPSVTLEKGAYRMRAPAKRSGLGGSLTIDPDLANNLKSAASRVRTRRGSQSTSRDGLPQILRQERQIAVLVILLVCATVTCFGGAYYLFTTRCVVLCATKVSC